jgi:hypothetical protein
MNRLPIGRRAQIINALVEGNSIRSTERMFDVHRDTIMRLLVEVGNGCASIGPGRYSPPRVTHQEIARIQGRPDPDHISTSIVERQNLTMRMSMRRFTRLTNGFSKKVENLRAAVGLHFAHYNFVRVHKSLRITPAMAADISDHLWTVEELVERIDAMAPPPKPRGPYKKRAA